MKQTQLVRVSIGIFELDLRSGELLANDQKTVLQEQPLRILRMLVEAEGELVSREAIRKKLWPNDTIVEFDHSINAAIKNLRRALGDSADDPKYIETLARRGYRLMVPAIRAAADDSSGAVAAVAGGAAVRLQPEVDSEAESGLIGKKVSHYRVLQVIGAGGMGLVYKAEDLKLGRPVALKFLPEELRSDPASLQRFEHEAKPFIVMELLEGETLRDGLTHATQSGEALPLEHLLDIGVQICAGLQAAHDKGIIHRDIKPANIFLTRYGQAKILDFGVAKLVMGAEFIANADAPAEERTGAPTSDLGPKDSSLTRTGTAPGTAGYMSPEQVRGESVDARTDLFSLGLVLYEMASGQRPFSGETQAVVREAILNSAPAPIRDLNATLPPELETIVGKALEKDREQRYQSAAEMKADLKALNQQFESGRGSALPRAKVKAALPRIKKIAVAVVAGLLLAALVAAGLYYRKHLRNRLTDKDTIVIGDFENHTGDPVFDDALKTGLTVALTQSPFLNVLSENKVAETLKRMTRPTTTKLTPEVAQELCRRADSAAYIAPAIASLGNEYVIALKAVNCQSGDTLAQEQVTAYGKEKVLNGLGNAAAKLRGQLGESLATVQKFDAPLATATTSSVEALQAFSSGIRASRKDQAGAIPFFQRAIDLDPNFALAYAFLSATYSNIGEQSRAMESARKAYDLREHLSGAERFNVSWNYYDNGLADSQKAMEVAEAWSQAYPNNSNAFVQLATPLAYLGRWDKALVASKEAVRLAPDDEVPLAHLTWDYLALNRFDEAATTLQEASAHAPDNDLLRLFTYVLAFLHGDAASMQQQLAWAAQHPEAENTFLALQADTDAYYGRLAKARATTEQAVQSARRADAKENAGTWQAYQALWDAEFGNRAPAHSAADEALRLAPASYSPRLVSAMALARAGQTAAAQKLADELAKEYPSDTGVQFFYLPAIRASIALDRGHPEQAVAVLQPATAYEYGVNYPALEAAPLYPAYLRGLAFLMAGKGTEAAAEFQKLIDHRGIVLNSPLGALAHLQIGRAYAMAGDRDKAKAAYQDFLALWKDADPDIPIYKEAKTEYAKLP